MVVGTSFGFVYLIHFKLNDESVDLRLLAKINLSGSNSQEQEESETQD